MQEVINETAGRSVKDPITTPAKKDANGITAINKKEEDEVKEETEAEVKESFKDENVPVEPAVGNDGMEVGGEG
jgi:hypothetical protein